jgi:RNA polymerase sigma-70 factor (ECF subfamily)
MGGPEAVLLEGLHEATPEAVSELYDRFGPSLLTFALAWFPGDRQLAEDIMARSLANAVLHIRGYQPRRSSLATWLHGIARRQIRDELRTRRRRKSVPACAQIPLEAGAGVADNGNLAADAVAHIDAQRLLLRVAAELSAMEYDVLVLSCIGQLSAKEIGRVVCRSEHAVRSLLHRARAKARERLVHDER